MVEQPIREVTFECNAAGSSRTQTTGRGRSSDNVVELEHPAMFVESDLYIAVRGLNLKEYLYKEIWLSGHRSKAI